MRLLVLTLFIFLNSLSSHAIMWNSNNSWDVSWEKKYEEWIEKTIDKDYFLKANFETDCADAVIALRIIFSRKNSLPFLFTTSNGDQYSNLTDFPQVDNKPVDSSVEWMYDYSFRKRLQIILNSTSSKTIINDAYPVALNASSIKPGVFFIHRFENSGHVDFIHRVVQGGKIMPIRMLSSTVPKKSRELLEYPFYFVSVPEKNKTGFFKFKKVLENNGTVIHSSFQKEKDYSLTQYAVLPKDKQFDDYVSYLVLGVDLSMFSKTYDLLQLLDRKIKDRIEIVRSGFEFCVRNNCNENSMNYYNYSSPSRDSNIQYIILQLRQVIRESATSSDFAEISTLFSEYSKNIYKIDRDKELDLNQIIEVWENAKYTSDPRDSVQRRWGI